MTEFCKKNKIVIYIALYIAAVAAVLAVSCSKGFGTSEDIRLLKIFKIVIYILSVTALFAAAYFLSGSSFSAERFFPAIALLLGLLYIACLTPFSVPDEEVHYRAAFQLSNYVLLKDNKEMLETEYTDYSGLTMNSNTPEGYLKAIKEFNAKPEENSEYSVDTLSGIWSMFYFAEYIPQTAGIALGRLLKLSFMKTFYLGRVFNLAFYCACLYFAMKRLPRFKVPLGLSAITPMAIQQASSLSYDCFINGMSFLVLAEIMNSCLSDEPFNKKEFIRTAILMMLLSPAKGAYVFFVFLFLFIPVKRFGKKRDKALYFIALLLLCIVFMGVVLLPSAVRILQKSEEFSNASSYSVLKTASLIYNSFKYYFASWVLTSVGLCLSGMNLTVPVWIIYSFIILLLASAYISSGGLKSASISKRLILLAVSAAIGVAFLAAMMLAWPDSNDIAIVGVQGRYFIPVVPVVLYAVSYDSGSLKPKLEKAVIFTWTALSCCVVSYIVYSTVSSF